MQNSPRRIKSWIWADRRPAGSHPAFLSLDALHADHEVPNVGTPVDEGMRLPPLAGLKRGDSVRLAVDEGLIAVGMIGDISVYSGLFAYFEEAVERLLICQHARIHPPNLPGRPELARDGASTPERKQMAASVIGDRHQHRHRARGVARRDVERERRLAERELLSVGDVHVTCRDAGGLLARLRWRQLRDHVPVHG